MLGSYRVQTALRAEAGLTGIIRLEPPLSVTFPLVNIIASNENIKYTTDTDYLMLSFVGAVREALTADGRMTTYRSRVAAAG